MWTKFLNTLGIETRAQREAKFERERLLLLAQARQAQARRRMQQSRNVIKTTDFPQPQRQIPQAPPKPTQQVRSERYGHDDYLAPGFNAYYVPTEFIPAVPPLMDRYETPSDSSSYSDSSSSSGSSFDSGSSSGSYDSGSSSSYDSGSSSSSDSGGGSW